ncbi:uncharacterized protein LOC111717517 [Eurytemora carolleeae]|uniref:uncharacterized protein LOC111717517 n=1 Tax=Eurytemora carolleeae TaxID=1294199 RepID=UPI000C780388|nr:uncharacterized protein LOC111717517 [Eurytemora carolleeae]|eukprot:XP_023348784.1 uncharacterized protein LOC111717517 [Eurytemora affinis]
MVTSTTVRVPNNGRKRGSMGHFTIFKNPSNIKRGSVDTASCGSNILTSKLGGSNNSLGKRESINSLGKSCSTSHNSLGRFGKHGDRNSIQMSGNTMMVKGEDGQMVECEIISSKEKESVFQKSIPIFSTTVAGIFGFLNLVPGLGTFLAALTLICGGKTSYSNNLEGLLVGLGTAFLQFLSAFLVVGWVWSIMHGVFMVRKANEAKEQETKRRNLPR